MSPADELGETPPDQLVAAPMAVPVPSPPVQVITVWPKTDVVAKVPQRIMRNLRIVSLVFISCNISISDKAGEEVDVIVVFIFEGLLLWFSFMFCGCV